MTRDRYRRAASEGVHIWVAIFIFVLFAVVYYFWQRESTAPEPVPETTRAPVSPDREPPASDEPAEPGPKYPVEEVSPLSAEQEEALRMPSWDVPLPALDESDAVLEDEVAKQSDEAEKRLEDLFIMDSFVRHFVVTVDNVTRSKLPQKYTFTQPPESRFLVTETEDGEYQINPENYSRYERYIRFVETFGTDNFVSLYVRYYPLFQQAYEELGYPDKYFNDRLVQVIDHLLATPDVEYPIKLVRPKTFYEFADPELNELSAGQKLILRIGPDNAARIKSELRELRAALTTLTTNRQG